jgi:hypothetical protein
MPEQLEILRRIAERGKALAEAERADYYVDLFNHLLSEIQVTVRIYHEEF